MSGGGVGRDARVLLLLGLSLPGAKKEGPAPLGVAEWCRIGGQLRRAGLVRPGELLDVEPGFWPTTALAQEEVARLRGLLEQGDALDRELERLAGLGIRVLTSVEPEYPARLRTRLRGLAPPVLFAAGDGALLERPGLAVVGSRDVDEAGALFTRAVAARCAQDGLTVVTGGARGVDQIAMRAALESGGAVVGIPAGGLERVLGENRQWMDDGRLLLLSPWHPKIGFTVGNAMARNKVIYALAEYGLVVSAAAGQGGTWAGAREVLRHGWVPLFVRDDCSAPDGNRELLRTAARPFPPLGALGDKPLGAWLAAQLAPDSPAPAPDAGAGSIGAQDLYSLFCPHLASFLETPRLKEEISTAFGLVPAQTSSWIRRAIAEGRVAKVEGHPRRYRTKRPSAQQFHLFERGPGYRAMGALDSSGEASEEVSCWPGDDVE
jgi:DNA processing protein